MTKSQRHQALALQKSATACYMAALALLLTFFYSFFAVPPYAHDLHLRFLQEDHFAFVNGGRWYFLVGVVAFVVMGLFSIRKANRSE